MPVVDPAGPLLGIVSRADLLKVFLRSDADIAREIRQQVLLRAMWMDPDTVVVDVRDGVVTLTGQLERRSLVPIIISLVRGLDGVVDVVDRLTFELDDTPIMVPSDLLFDRASASAPPDLDREFPTSLEVTTMTQPVRHCPTPQGHAQATATPRSPASTSASPASVATARASPPRSGSWRPTAGCWSRPTPAPTRCGASAATLR